MGETISQLAERVGVARGTVVRWMTHGVQVGAGVAKLAAVRVGGRWSIPAEAWERFQLACNPGERPAPESPAALARRKSAARKLALEILGGK